MHGFRNTSNESASLLILFAPGDNIYVWGARCGHREAHRWSTPRLREVVGTYT